MCEEVITEHSLKSLEGLGTYSVAIATKFPTDSTRFYLDLYGYKVSFDSDT